MIDVAQFLGQALPGAERRAAGAERRGPRAGRVNGVIQYARVTAARELPGENAADVNGAASPTINGASVVTPAPIDNVTPVSATSSTP
jgi:hypothetical protein